MKKANDNEQKEQNMETEVKKAAAAKSDAEKVKAFSAAIEKIKSEIKKDVVGQLSLIHI